MDGPVLVYDDDCGFCTWWADLFAERSDLDIVGFTELTPGLRERLPADYEECAHLVTDDEVYSCGESVERAFLRSDPGEGFRPVVDFLRNFEDYGTYRERAYRWAADNRDRLGLVVSRTPPARADSAGDESESDGVGGSDGSVEDDEEAGDGDSENGDDAENGDDGD